MRRVLASFLLPAWSGLWFACASFSDAKSDAPDAATSGGDAASDDGSNPGDAGDANDPCKEPTTLFCDDFERDPIDLRGTGWTNFNSFGQIGLGIDSTQALSKPRALRATIGAPVGSGGGGNYLFYAYEGTGLRRVDVSFAMYVEKVPPAPLRLAQVELENGGIEGEAVFRFNDDGSVSMAEQYENQEAGSSEYDEIAGPILPLKTWRRVRLRIDLDSKETRLSIEGVAQDFKIAKPVAKTAIRELRIGIPYAKEGTAPIDVWFDDVILRR